MTEVISVRFRGGCKNYFFDPKGKTVKMGDQVIVETAQGPEFGTCTHGNHEVQDHAILQPLNALLRLATDADRRTVEYNRKKESHAFDVCEKKIVEHGLEMKLVKVSASFDGSKIIFFFTADGRVDFRELVRDLASVFRARIELRQIGVRDEAKMVGGLGICGRPFCCSQFLDGFLPVSIKMAKTQNLSLNPTKISGTCGRLMCCLKYEQNAYEDAQKRLPRQDSFVQTPDGPGNVKSVDLLRETVKVSLDSAPEQQKCYHNCEVCVLRNGKGSRDGIEVPTDRPARYVEETEDEFMAPVMLSAFGGEQTEARFGSQREKAGFDEGEGKNRRRPRNGRRYGNKPDMPGKKGPAKQGGNREKPNPPPRPQRPKQDRQKNMQNRPAPAKETGKAVRPDGENKNFRRYRGGRRYHNKNGGSHGGGAPSGE